MPRSLDDILLELEEIEGEGANLEDPEADYERREVRPDDMADEAAGLGAEVLPLLEQRLIEAQKLPQEVGYLRRRPFLCTVLARVAPTHPEQSLAVVAKLPKVDVERVVQELPGPEAHATLAAWFVGRSRFAKSTGGGKPGLRRLLLKALVDAHQVSDAVREAAKTDPDEKVRDLVR